MTDNERDIFRRRKLLGTLAKLAVAAPALQALAGCGDDAGAQPQAPGTPGAPTGQAPVAGSGTTTSPAVGAAGRPATPPSAGAGNGGAAGKPTASAGAGGKSEGGKSEGGKGEPQGGSVAVSGGKGDEPEAGAGGMGGAAAPTTGVDISSLACVVSPAVTEGPFFVDKMLNRSDLRSEDEPNVKNGVPLDLTFGVFKVDGMMCTPVVGAMVDIWHADTQGVYASVNNPIIQRMDTTAKSFLRGYQVTDENGLCTFKTIYPGWYGSRCVHIHFKIRGQMGVNLATFTSQIFFEDDLNAEVLMTPGYKQGPPAVTNRRDQVFTTGDGGGAPGREVPESMHVPGDELIVALKPVAATKGYEGAFRVGLRM